MSVRTVLGVAAIVATLVVIGVTADGPAADPGRCEQLHLQAEQLSDVGVLLEEAGCSALDPTAPPARPPVP